jgi:hypothetical protein
MIKINTALACQTEHTGKAEDEVAMQLKIQGKTEQTQH